MSSSLAHDRAVRPVGCDLYFLPVQTRVPLKFGHETLTEVICARVKMIAENRSGKTAEGWGETPLSVQWVWPSELPYADRLNQLKAFCVELARAWSGFDSWGHPLEVGHAFLSAMPESSMPTLARLACCSPFDIAMHDAFGKLHEIGVYETYTRDWMSCDLTHFFGDRRFAGKFPAEFLVPRQNKLVAWHLVGGLDPVCAADLHGDEPDDGYPLLLPDWIRRDGLQALKIKLRGNDRSWDIDRLTRVGQIALEHRVEALSADFNCTVTDPEYVIDILDRLQRNHSAIGERLLYVEQPFPHDLEAHRIDVRQVAARKPLFLDESAHDWRMVELGLTLGWNGVALKTCKTQSGAILSLCWGRARGMQIMVQDLTNPMLAMIPHALLAAHANTIMGVETNAPQFYPDASASEAAVHPNLYRRRNGVIDLSTIHGAGFGYRLNEVLRALPSPAGSA